VYNVRRVQLLLQVKTLWLGPLASQASRVLSQTPLPQCGTQLPDALQIPSVPHVPERRTVAPQTPAELQVAVRHSPTWQSLADRHATHWLLVVFAFTQYSRPSTRSLQSPLSRQATQSPPELQMRPPVHACPGVVLIWQLPPMQAATSHVPGLQSLTSRHAVHALSTQ